MNRYLKLVVMELHRFWKMYVGLAVLTVVSQVGGMIYGLNVLVSRVDRMMEVKGFRTYAEYAATLNRSFEYESFHTAANAAEPWMSGPIFLCVTALIGYCFFIWYRDWAGKSTFAYRLLMLPTARMNLFWSKLTAIMLFVLGLVALQLILIPVLIGLYHQMIPAELAIPETVRSFVTHDRIFQTLIPATFTGFLVSYGTGLLGVIVLFTAILIERSYRLIGIVVGIIYVVLAALAMLLPYIVTMFESEYVLYPLEIFLLQLGIGLVLLGVSLVLSRYLLVRKISV